MIDLYCGLVRNDSDTLELLAAEFERHDRNLSEMVKDMGWTEPLEQLQLPRIGDKNDFVEKLTKQLTGKGMTTEERDQRAERVAPKERDAKPALERPEVQGKLALWILALWAYSVALKNLEHIPKEVKEKHLTRILSGWATVLRYACLLFNDALQTKELQVGSLKLELSLPEDLSARFARMIFLTIPNVVSFWVRSDLGSHKLEAQLKNDELAESISALFLQKGISGDLKLPEYMGELKKLHEKIKGSEFLLGAFLIKLRDIYIRFGLSPEEEMSFLRLVAEVSADAQGLTGEDRRKRISSAIQDLERANCKAWRCLGTMTPEVLSSMLRCTRSSACN